MLDYNFVPELKIPFERHLFRKISQESGETVDQFMCRLQQRAATCEFCVNKDRRSEEAVDRQLNQYNMDQADQVNAVSGKMDRNWNPRKLLALVTDRKDTLVRIRGAQCEVRLAGSALR